MSAVQEGTFGCVCGQTFANALSLKHHRWVTKHEPIDVPPHTPRSEEEEAAEAEEERLEETERAYETALELIRAGRESQDDYERQLAAGPPAYEVVVNWALENAGAAVNLSRRAGHEAIHVGLSFSHQVVNKLLMIMVLLVMTASLLTVGVRIGAMVASDSHSTGADSAAPVVLTAQI